jgi:hypothetical protein
MKKITTISLWALLLSALLVISCSLPQGPAGLPPDTPLVETTLLMVETDVARGQGIYLNEAGQRQDIQSFEGNEDRTVSCVQAIAILPMRPAVAARGMSREEPDLKAVIIGMRDDGRPGVWAVYGDDTIHPLFLKEGERSCSLLPESESRRGGMRGLFGWKYTPIAARSNGSGDLLIVGEAINEEGFQLGPWSVEADTRVGIYWKLIRHHRRGFYHVSSARVIGTPPESRWSGHSTRSRHRRGFYYGFYGHFLSSLRLFFLSYYEAYLVDLNITADNPDNLEEFRWDADAGLYLVRGIDQDGDPALATITPDETILISKEEPGGGQPDLVASGLNVDIITDAAGRWILQTEVENSGSTASPECAIAYFLSDDDQLDSGTDTLISGTGADFVLPALAAGEETLHTFTIDPVTDASFSYILVQADAADTVDEESEENNIAVLKIRFPRVVIESFHPGGALEPSWDTRLSFYDNNGNFIESSYDGILFAVIDYPSGLTVGKYYIKVSSDTGTTGPYAIRVVEDGGEAYPAPFDVVAGDDADNEALDPLVAPWVSGSPVGIILGSANRVGRYLDPSGEVDWLELQLVPAN